MRGGRAFRLACHNSGTGIFDRVRTVRGGGACPKKKIHDTRMVSVEIRNQTHSD